MLCRTLNATATHGAASTSPTRRLDNPVRSRRSQSSPDREQHRRRDHCQCPPPAAVTAPGLTNHWLRTGLGSRRISAARTARSAQSN